MCVQLVADVLSVWLVGEYSDCTDTTYRLGGMHHGHPQSCYSIVDVIVICNLHNVWQCSGVIIVDALVTNNLVVVVIHHPAGWQIFSGSVIVLDVALTFTIQLNTVSREFTEEAEIDRLALFSLAEQQAFACAIAGRIGTHLEWRIECVLCC